MTFMTLTLTSAKPKDVKKLVEMLDILEPHYALYLLKNFLAASNGGVILQFDSIRSVLVGKVLKSMSA